MLRLGIDRLVINIPVCSFQSERTFSLELDNKAAGFTQTDIVNGW